HGVVITDYLGSKPVLGDAKSALDAFRADLPKMSQKMADSSIPMRSRPGSGASIRSRLAAMPAPKRYNTPHCLTWWGNPRSTAVCYLPASIPWRSPKRQACRCGARQGLGTQEDLATATSNARSSKRDIQVLAEYDQGVACQWRSAQSSTNILPSSRNGAAL